MDDKVYGFGEIIKRERTLKGYSLKELSDRMGKKDGESTWATPSYLNRLEKNEMSNPTFALVCKIVDVLELDLREVLKSFGFENLNKNAGESQKFNSITELIRLADIKAPILSKDGVVSQEEFLSMQEKELLLSIIKYVFRYGSEELLNSDIIRDVLLKLDSFRLERLSTLKLKKLLFTCRAWRVLNHEFMIYINEEVSDLIIKLKLTKDDIYDIVETLQERILDIANIFTVHNKEKGVTVSCVKENNLIKVNSVSVVLIVE